MLIDNSNELESLLIKMENNKKEYNKKYHKDNKNKLKEKEKERCKKLGFSDRAQKQRYDRYRKRNSLSRSVKDQNYLDGIEWWKENVDKK